jgi:hypothetical protein
MALASKFALGVQNGAYRRRGDERFQKPDRLGNQVTRNGK